MTQDLHIAEPLPMHDGLGQANGIGVVAKGDKIAIYVNGQLVTSVKDSTYSSGQIGVVVYDTGNPTETIYSNLKVWQL